MSHKTKIIGGVLVLLLVVSGLGLKYFLTSPPTKKTIVVVLPSDRNPFWIEVRQGAEKAALGLADNYIVTIATSSDQDATSQNTILDNLYSRRQADALILGPANDHVTVPKVAKFIKDKIPVIIIDTELNKKELADNGVTPTAFIGSSNRDGGEKAAREMARVLKQKGYTNKVLLIEGSFVHQSAIDRTEGFLNIAKEVGLDVESVKGEWRQDRAQELVSSRFSREKFGGIFANNDDMALGAIAGLKNLNVNADKWPIIIGFDATKDALESIARGEMYATVKQDAALMGSEAVLAAQKALVKDSTLRPHRLLEVNITPQR